MGEMFDMPEVLSAADVSVGVPVEPASTRWRLTSWWLFPIGFILALVVLVLVIREPMEPLEPECLEDAHATWIASGCMDYDMILSMRAGSTGVTPYAVSVRNGRVVSLSSEGAPGNSARVQDFGIDGLFDILRREYDLAQDPSLPFDVPARQVMMRVRFDADLGYPVRYLRSLGNGRPSMGFEVREFAIADS